MIPTVYKETVPKSLSPLIFRLFQYVEFDLRSSPGIMVEDCCPEFMFLEQKDVFLKIEGKPAQKLPRAFSLGKIKGPYKFRFPGKISLFSIKLQPWVAGFFFPDKITDIVIDLSRFFDLEIKKLCLKIFSQTSFDQKVKEAEEFFEENIDLPKPSDFEKTMTICKEIYRFKGMIRIGELIGKFPESRQKINRDFLSQTKFSIKEFAIFVKLREAIKFINRHPDITLTELALEFGYFDQSHFIRDIKRVTGVTPGYLFSTKNLVSEQLKSPT